MAIKPGPTGFVALEHRPRAHRPKCDCERLDRYMTEVASKHHPKDARRAARVVSLRTARTRKRRSHPHAVCVGRYFKLQPNWSIDPSDCFSVCKRVEPSLVSVRFRLRSGPVNLDFGFPLEGLRAEAIEHAWSRSSCTVTVYEIAAARSPDNSREDYTRISEAIFYRSYITVVVVVHRC